MDGSEDSEIHCLRSGMLPEEAADKLAQQTAALVAAEDEDVDPFADLEDDEEELELNWMKQRLKEKLTNSLPHAYCNIV